MIDGECTLTDFNKTLENKALVSKFVNEVMIDLQKTVYFTDRLLQQPLLADGAEVFLPRYVGATAEKRAGGDKHVAGWG